MLVKRAGATGRIGPVAGNIQAKTMLMAMAAVTSVSTTGSSGGTVATPVRLAAMGGGALGWGATGFMLKTRKGRGHLLLFHPTYIATHFARCPPPAQFIVSYPRSP